MNCPHCGAPATQTQTGNSGTLFVGESIERDVETYDSDIAMFRCTKVKSHVFYTRARRTRASQQT